MNIVLVLYGAVLTVVILALIFAKSKLAKAERLTPLEKIISGADEIADAIKCSQNEEYQKALDICDEVLKHYPHYSDAYQVRGVVLFDLKDYEQAVEEFSKAIELQPNSAEYYRDRSQAYICLGKSELAVLDLKQAIRLRPSFLDAYLMGNIFFAMQDYQEAIDAYTKAIYLESSVGEIYMQRARVYEVMENYNEAIADVDKAIELSIEDGKLYVQKGIFYGKMKKYSESLDAYEEALKIDSSNVNIYLNRGVTYVRMKNYELALDDFNQADKLIPNNMIVHSNRGACHIEMKKYDQAQIDLESALAADPGYPAAIYNMSSLFSLRNEVLSACEWLLRAVELRPSLFEYVQTDVNFDGIRNTSEYQAVMKKILELESVKNLFV